MQSWKAWKRVFLLWIEMSTQMEARWLVSGKWDKSAMWISWVFSWSVRLLGDMLNGRRYPRTPLYSYAFGGPYLKSPALKSCIRLRNTHFIYSHIFACFVARFHRLNIWTFAKMFKCFCACSAPSRVDAVISTDQLNVPQHSIEPCLWTRNVTDAQSLPFGGSVTRGSVVVFCAGEWDPGLR